MKIKALYAFVTHRYYLSILAIMLGIGLCMHYSYKHKGWEDPRTPIQWDVISYYEYLPAVLVHHDWSLSFLDKQPELKGRFWYSDGPDNSKVIRTSLGMSVLYSPFYLIAHALAPSFGYPRDGFSDPYEIALIAGSIFFSLLGLIFIRKTLRLFCSDLAVSLTIISLILATNLFHYTAVEGPMTHAWLFAFYAILTFCVVKWHKTNQLVYFYWISFISGIMLLVRPTEIVVLLLPLTIGIVSYKTGREKILALLQLRWKLLLGTLLFILPFTLQMFYWKDVTGRWLYYSYQEYGFFFDSPMILEGLFSYRKGWFIYTPIASFFMIGFYFLYKKQKELFTPIAIWFCVNLYITFSWCIWWYGGSFGMRALVQGTALLALNMCFMYEALLKRWITGLLLVLAIGYFIQLNYSFTDKAARSMIHYDSMTKDAYWFMFNKEYMKPEDWPVFEKYLEKPDYESRKKKPKESQQ